MDVEGAARCSIARIDATALSYAPGGTPNAVPRRLARYFARIAGLDVRFEPGRKDAEAGRVGSASRCAASVPESIPESIPRMPKMSSAAVIADLHEWTGRDRTCLP
jgi:hypothetical protein